MRPLATLCVLLVILIDFSMQFPQYENCQEAFLRAGKQDCACCKVTCSSKGNIRIKKMMLCGTISCHTKVLKYIGGNDNLVNGVILLHEHKGDYVHVQPSVVNKMDLD
ncbi:hypothetical protein HN011_003987 [Eciton burchellii]|nr:hypothetical protein HN011_003987 [Eciton burchellii]